MILVGRVGALVLDSWWVSESPMWTLDDLVSLFSCDITSSISWSFCCNALSYSASCWQWCARFAVPVPFPREIPTLVCFCSSSLLLLHMASISSAHCRFWQVPPAFVLAHCVNHPGYGPVGSTIQIRKGNCWKNRGKNRFASYEVHTGHFFTMSMVL